MTKSPSHLNPLTGIFLSSTLDFFFLHAIIPFLIRRTCGTSIPSFLKEKTMPTTQELLENADMEFQQWVEQMESDSILRDEAACQEREW